ncbi:MAG: exodeoxyribonuclease VII small subunit [Deltaproteobacteria bacterium]|jgi:exodeoxyribonuclease VII small subunit|nr:exodeoxyribonuclease VII small subunit [Deltaproteobacteria bacterium]
MAKQTFESAMKQLEQIAQELEAGELSLELAMKKFEEGIQLSRFCTKKLDETERRITILLQDSDGSVQEVPFEEKQDED